MKKMIQLSLYEGLYKTSSWWIDAAEIFAVGTHHVLELETIRHGRWPWSEVTTRTTPVRVAEIALRNGMRLKVRESPEQVVSLIEHAARAASRDGA